MIKRLEATEKTITLVRKLKELHGELMFYQAGGCCEGTQPQCFEKGGFFQRMNDIMIGKIENSEFWIDRDLFEYWKFSHFTLNVLDGFGAGGFHWKHHKEKCSKYITGYLPKKNSVI